jgi:O-antigen ligase
LIVVLTSMLLPGDIAKLGGANIAAMDVFTLIALASWLINNAVGNAPDIAVRGRPIVIACIIFAALQWVSLIWSSNPHRTVVFAIQAVELFIAYPLLFGSLPRSIAHIEKALVVLLVGTAVMAVVLLIVYARNPDARTVGTYLPGLNKNAAGAYESFGIVIAFALLLRRRGFRWWLIAILLLDTGGLVASASRGAMLGAAAGVAIVSLMMRRGKLAPLMVFVMLGAVYFAVIAPSEAQKTQAAGSQSSASARIVIWQSAIDQIEHQPFLGVGGGAYWDPLHFQGDPNNTILRTWAEVGIPGLVTLLYLLIAFARTIPPWRRFADRDVSALAAACAGIFVCQFMHGQVDVSWTRGTSSIMFAALGLMLALDRIVQPLAVTEPSVEETDVAPVPALRAA